MRSKRISEQLGMSHGAAAGQLRKRVLFHLLTKLGENVCFKCSEVIDKVEDLSIEHKQPWEGRSAELFWDIENIAFSHLHCNRVDTNGAIKLRKVGPPGTAWCSVHKQFLPVGSFNKKSDRWSGINWRCRDCANKFLEEYRERKPRRVQSRVGVTAAPLTENR